MANIVLEGFGEGGSIASIVFGGFGLQEAPVVGDFIVEDGTGKPDAVSYASVEFADAYFNERYMVEWTGTTAQKRAWLIRATDYLETRFGLNFIGSQKTQTQALSWPRINTGYFADNVIPVKLVKACCEYAIRAKVAPLAPDVKIDSSGVVVVATKKKVGPLETEYSIPSTGFGSTVSLIKPYPGADMLLKGLVNFNNRVIR